MPTEIEGRIGLHVEVKLTMEDIRTWSPERIAQLFHGIAEVRAAVDGVDISSVRLRGLQHAQHPNER